MPLFDRRIRCLCFPRFKGGGVKRLRQEPISRGIPCIKDAVVRVADISHAIGVRTEVNDTTIR